MYQVKKQDRTPEKKPKWSGDMQCSRKRIQNNDSEDDPGPWKKMEAKIKKMQEMFNKDLERIKEQANRDEQYNNRNEKWARRNQ